MPATYEPIATTTLGTAAATIVFNSIGSSYTDLRIVLTGATLEEGQNLWLRFNSDTGTNYSRTWLRGDGSSAASGANTSANFLRIGDGASYGTSATIPGFWSIDIFSYAGSTNKTLLARESMDKNGSGGTLAQVGLWRSTSAITSITLGTTATSYNAGSTATLFGIKAA